MREHGDVFGLGKGDIANLALVARDVSPDGITHLRFNQVLDGIQSFDSGLDAHVTRGRPADQRLRRPVAGRAACPARDPPSSAGAGLGEAAAGHGGAGLAAAHDRRRARPEPRRRRSSTRRARRRCAGAATPDGPPLAWHVIADGGDGTSDDVLVDADDGELAAPPGPHAAPRRGAATSRATPTATPARRRRSRCRPPGTTTAAGGTRLWGQYARTYIDPNDQDPAAGSEIGGTASRSPRAAPAAGLALRAEHDVPRRDAAARPAAAPGTAPTPATATTNQLQAATNAPRARQPLPRPPRRSRRSASTRRRATSSASNTSGQGLGGDYVRAEVNDGAGASTTRTCRTPPDGQAPRMQMFLFTRRDVNGADDADVVYHEYGHGLSNRLVVNAVGQLGADARSRRGMMGEAWSDFYAHRPAQRRGHADRHARRPPRSRSARTSSARPASAPSRSTARSTRRGSPAATATARRRRCSAATPTATSPVTEQHRRRTTAARSGRETLWDIRTRVRPRRRARAGHRRDAPVAVDNPSMLDMRDAILQQAVAMRSAPGAAGRLLRRPVGDLRGPRHGRERDDAERELDRRPTEAFDAADRPPRAARRRSATPTPVATTTAPSSPASASLVDQAVAGHRPRRPPGRDRHADLGRPGGRRSRTARRPGRCSARAASRVNGDPLAGRMPRRACTDDVADLDRA